jgi:putative flippase GtrA
MQIKNLIRTFIRAFISGGAATIINFALLALFIERFAIYPTAASASSFSIAVIFNYLCQYFWAFKASGPHRLMFFRFIVVNILMLAVNTSLFWYFTERLNLPYLISQTIAIAVVFLSSFTINHAYTFKSTTTTELT